MASGLLKITAFLFLFLGICLCLLCYPEFFHTLIAAIPIPSDQLRVPSGQLKAVSHILKVSRVLPVFLIGYGVFFLLIAVLSYIVSLKSDAFFKLVSNKIKYDIDIFYQEARLLLRNIFVSRWDFLNIAFICTIGFCVRTFFLFQPMRYDEAFTFITFVNRSFPFLFLYSAPNNHVLHTLLVKVSVLLFGSNPLSIRLPAFLGGMIIIPLVFIICRTLSRRGSGVFAAIGMAIFPYMILYSTMARGYTILVCLSLILLLIGFCYVEQASITGMFMFSCVSALGIFTVPTMLFPISGIYAWMGCLLYLQGWKAKNIVLKFVMPSGVIVSLFTLIIYSPVIVASGGINLLIANRFVQSLPWINFIHGVPSHFRNVYYNFTRDVPSVVIVMILIFMISGIAGAFKNRNWHLLLLLPCMFGGAGLLFVLKQRIPPVRTWIFLIPFIFILADSGVDYLCKIFSNRSRMIINTFMIVPGIFFSIFLMTKDVIARYPDTGAFPEAQEIALFLKPVLTNTDTIHAQIPANCPLRFYLWYYGAPDVLWKTTSQTQREFFVIQADHGYFDDMGGKHIKKLMDMDGVDLYVCEQSSVFFNRIRNLCK